MSAVQYYRIDTWDLCSVHDDDNDDDDDDDDDDGDKPISFSVFGVFSAWKFFFSYSHHRNIYN